jgi:O-antigen/teichoic acid export membrane protein
MSLKRSITTGVKWSGISQYGRQVTQLATLVILARLLKPADFGLVGMATVVIGFVGIFKDLGTSAAVIQRKELSESLLSSIFWVNTMFGCLASLTLYLLSPLISRFYHEPRLVPILHVLSITFLISGLSILQQALLEREIAFGKLATLEIVASLLGSVAGIGAALLGCGVWSLVYQTLVVATVTTIMLWIIAPWRFSLSFSLEEVKSIGNYSINLTGFNVFNYIVRNADYLLVGKFMGAQDLGYYTLAYRVMIFPLQSVTYVIGRVMFPAFSQIQHDDCRFRNAYLKIIGTIAVITFPMMLGILAVAQPFVLVAFGERWRPVILLLMILAPVGMAQSIAGTVGVIYQVKGRTDLMFRWGVATGIISVFSFVVGLRWGIVGVSTAYAIYNVVLAFPNYAIPFRLIRLPLGDFGKVLWRPFASGSLMLIAILGARSMLPPNLAYGSSLAILIPLGVMAYFSATILLNRNQMLQVLDTIRTRA